MVFASKLLVDSLISYNISDEYDHDSNLLPILSTWNLWTMVRPLEKKKHFKKTDIKKLIDMLKGELTGSVQTAPKSTQELDQQMDALVTVLTKAIDASTPMLQVSPRFIPGFDKECKEVQMKACHLKKKVKKEPSPELWEEYKQAQAFKKRLISKKKREAYREYCSFSRQTQN